MSDARFHAALLSAIFLLLCLVTLLESPPVVDAAEITETIVIDGDDGQDCWKVGNWNSATRTCKLTRDVSSVADIHAINIRGRGITLDGDGHALTGPCTGSGAGGTQNCPHDPEGSNPRGVFVEARDVTIAGGGSATFTLKFAVPSGVARFMSGIFGTARDACDNQFAYPGPLP